MTEHTWVYPLLLDNWGTSQRDGNHGPVAKRSLIWTDDRLGNYR